MIENLQVMLERNELALHDDPELVNEFSAFEYSYSHRTRQVSGESLSGLVPPN